MKAHMVTSAQTQPNINKNCTIYEVDVGITGETADGTPIECISISSVKTIVYYTVDVNSIYTVINIGPTNENIISLFSTFN